jgi:mannose-6-phosphate isomerase-like protein (cupin superfamily)
MIDSTLEATDASLETKFTRQAAPEPAPALVVRESHLVKALSAGWLTDDDLRFVLPLLALAYPGSAIERRLSALSLQPAALSEAPSFLKYFLSCREQARHPGTSAIDAFAVDDLVANIINDALGRAMHKASLIDGGQEPWTARAPTPSHAAYEPAVAPHLSLLSDLYSEMRHRRLLPMFERIQLRLSLERPEEPATALFPGVGDIMFSESDDKRSIEFTVERYPCTAEVLDPRVVRIPPGKSNNRHKHAHETLFYFVSGTGEILVGEKWVPVRPGDAVFAPRWAIHQTRNTGTSELTLLAITDYYLTSQVYVGKYDKI